MKQKYCNKCGELKNLSEFYIRKNVKDKRTSACKKCRCAFVKEYRIKNSEKIKETEHKYNIRFPERGKKWRVKNPEKAKKIIKRAREKRLSTPKGKLNQYFSSAISNSLKQGSKAGRCWESLVNYTIDQLKKHLEKLFKPGMTWENYGKVWEIDHKTPIVVFNFDKPEHIDFRLCWSLRNLQPLEVGENRRKHDCISKPFQPSLKIEII